MKARKVKATFEIREDSDNAGVVFYAGGKKTTWSSYADTKRHAD